MADKSTQIVLDALGRAVAEPAGVPLHNGKSARGLFPTSTLARQVAQRCKDEGLVQVLEVPDRSRSGAEVCTITDKGLSYLMSQVSPQQILEDLVRAAEGREAQLAELIEVARQAQASCVALVTLAERVLRQMSPPVPGPGNGSILLDDAVLSHLRRWEASGAAEDCSLPDLFRAVRQAIPTLTVGAFHDGLRRMYDQERTYLHPWTGPLCDLPEPSLALLVGHEIAYYASLRGSGSGFRS